MAQEHLQALGIEVNFLQNRIQDLRNGHQKHSVVGARLLEHCEKLLLQMHTQADADWERAIQVFPTSKGPILAVQESTMDPESTNIPSLVNLWEFARAMNMDESVAERISSLLVDHIVLKLLGDVQSWNTVQSTTADGILTQLQFTVQPASSPPGTAISAVVDMLTFLRNFLFVPSAQDKPAVQDSSLAPTLQVFVAQRFVPRLLAELKSYLLRCLPHTDLTLHAYTKAVETVSHLVLQVHTALVENGFVREAQAAGTMVRRPGWAPMEPLSDLRQWAEQLPNICTQRVLGDVLDHVRATILRTDDKAWDTVTVQRQVEEVKAQAPKTESKTAPKPTTKAAPVPPQASEKDLKLAQSTVSTAATQPPPQDDASDWGWGSDDEVEDILGAQDTQIESSTPQDSASKPNPEAHASEAAVVHDDSALDAWDWNEPDEESPLPESTPLSPVRDAPESSKAVVTRERVVSQRCEAVVQQAQQQFAQLAYTSDPRLVQVIQEALLACFQLYRALMPTVHAASLQHVPLLSMLFASDCNYLAEEMRSMAQRQSCSEAAPTGASSLHTALLHEAQATLDTGIQWRDAQIAVQTYALQECLDQADGFARTDDDARFAMCERAVAQVDHILQHLANVWMPVLTQDMLVSLLGKLVHSVFTRVQDSVEDLDDIGEAESIRLAPLCRTLLDAQTALFARVSRCDAEAAGALAATVVPNWFKFSYLPELLTGSLADIEFLVFESGGALLDYGREEIMALIRALFADTHNRRQLLDRIQRAPWTSTQAGLA
ncbi:ribosome biogenesis protein ytm1 [Malassezia brasiliensis]|uniref:Ribosome biogenesis protein ytm1 n=1 Tax=Malassezia brasiliensis TaxID=1821822 RepID=A0AAF0DUH6_9BASI|nr:ribosome biogenesis protein ytm1 [Malassezia brasiliensis]